MGTLPIDTLQSVDDSKVGETRKLLGEIPTNDATFIAQYSAAVKAGNLEFSRSNLIKYCNVIIKEFLPNDCIPYNAILTLTQMLFSKNPNILKFYTHFYSTMLVDEFQDTNILSFDIIEKLIVDKSKIILLGDSLQRIYGFIGAVENLLPFSQSAFGLKKIELSKNYRFASNPEMLLLDSNIRKNAENPVNPVIHQDANVRLKILESQEEESSKVAKLSRDILERYPAAKIAILVKQRGINVASIIEQFEQDEIPFFYGLFTDEDQEYVSFNRKSLHEFIELIKSKETITKKLAKQHLAKLEGLYEADVTPLNDALISLLEVFWGRIFIDFSFLSNDEKIVLIKDTFEHNGLKQYLEFIPTNIVISTVHAAKGLEWDYVILPDIEENSFPNWYGLCSNCTCNSDCIVSVDDKNKVKFLEELSVFYVAVTRARKQVFFTASKTAPDNYGNHRPKNLSCFLKLPGIKHC